MSNLMWIAYISMIVDHIGAVFFPQYFFLRIIGRIAAPIFIYKIVKGYKYSKNLKMYKNRLLLCAVSTQFFYKSIFNTKTLNICFTLYLCILIFESYDYFSTKNFSNNLNLIKHTLITVIILILALMNIIEYGWFAIILAFYFFITYPMKKTTNLFFSLSIVFIFNYVFFKYTNTHIIQLASCFSIPIIYYVSDKLTNKNFHYNYLIYPVHFILFWILLKLG